MLDASVVFSKVGSQPLRHMLSNTAPDVIVDAGPAGANVVADTGSVMSATIDNQFVPGAWTAVGGGGQAVASGRRAFKLAGRDPASLTITWS